MNKYHIAKKYSRALTGSAEIREIPGVINELKRFSVLIDSNRQLKILFSGRIFTDKEKADALNTLFSRINARPQTGKILKRIILEGHLPALKEIIKASVNMYNELQRKADALVISPSSLGEKQIERLKKALGSMTGRVVEIENRTDPSLFGGFIVKMGSTVYDSSISGQLRLLRAELTK